MGAYVENQNYVQRVDYLRSFLRTTLRVIRFRFNGIHWVIVGVESGNKHREMASEWVENIRDRCQEAGVAFFFKQWGGRTPKANGRLLDDKIWDEMPEAWEKHRQHWQNVPVKSRQVEGKKSLTSVGR